MSLTDFRRRSAPSRIGPFTIAVVLLMRALASAQDVTESALKAAFIYNFAKFTEWPADVLSGAEPFVLCVLGDSTVSDALERTVKARVLAGHSLTVSYVEPGAQPRTCHGLYVSGGDVRSSGAGRRAHA